MEILSNLIDSSDYETTYVSYAERLHHQKPHRQRQTDRQIESQTIRQTDRQIVRQTDRHTVRQTDTRIDGLLFR